MSILRAPGWAARIDESFLNEAREAYFPEVNKFVDLYAAKYYPNSIATGTLDGRNKLYIKMLRNAIIHECENRNDELAARINKEEDNESRSGGELKNTDVDSLINVIGDATFTAKTSDFAVGDMIFFAKRGEANISFEIDGANVIKTEDTYGKINGMVLVKNTQNQFLAFNDFKQQYEALETEITGMYDETGKKARQGTSAHRITLSKMYILKTKGFGSKIISTAAATLIENLKTSIETKTTDYMSDISLGIQAHKQTKSAEELAAKRGSDEKAPDLRYKMNEWSKVLSKLNLNDVTNKVNQEEETPVKEDKLKTLQLVTAILQKFSNIVIDNDDVANGIIKALEVLKSGSASDFIDKLIENLYVLTLPLRDDDEVKVMYDEIVGALTAYKESVKLTRKQTDRLLQEQYIKRKQFAYRIEELFRG